MENKYNNHNGNRFMELNDGIAETEADSEDKYEEYEGFVFLQHQDIVCSNQNKSNIPKSWILLDNQSMVNMFSHGKLLSNIRDAKWVLTLYCNLGKAIVTKKGDPKGYGMVRYRPEVIANILSLHRRSTR